MSLLQLKRELAELRTQIIRETEPVCRVFIFDGQTTTEGLTAADLEAYKAGHPHTHVVTLYLQDMGVPE